MSNLIISQSVYSRYFNQLSDVGQIKDWRTLSSKFADMQDFLNAKLSDLVKLRIMWIPVIRRYYGIKANKDALKAEDIKTFNAFVQRFFDIDKTQVKYYIRAAELVVNGIADIDDLSGNLKSGYKVNIEPVKVDGKIQRTEDGLRVLEAVEVEDTPTDIVTELQNELKLKQAKQVKLRNQLKAIGKEIAEIQEKLKNA